MPSRKCEGGEAELRQTSETRVAQVGVLIEGCQRVENRNGEAVPMAALRDCANVRNAWAHRLS